ncbi:MAG TPA: TetR/AcrR family transcriptional regulator [Vicinamibacterales bacterium]|jgi:AcrR family transcriptional regulator|nr:TetR/AcrR family transcriptional regulator [Vicinamibacterales bacterium]
MRAAARQQFEPRKTPVQTRAAVTVGAIAQATIQVLLSDGVDRLTKTRVAERAGVSVGTLYQYYPNKQSLLFAVLADHLDNVAAAVETACEQARHKPVADMLRTVVEAFVDAKMKRTDISLALYQFAAEIDGPALVKRMGQRSVKALAAILQTAPDTESPPDKFAIEIMFAAMAGATRHVLESGASPAMIRNLRHHLVVLCQSYIAASMPDVG